MDVHPPKIDCVLMWVEKIQHLSGMITTYYNLLGDVRYEKSLPYNLVPGRTNGKAQNLRYIDGTCIFMGMQTERKRTVNGV
jgi:hypothetical protein